MEAISVFDMLKIGVGPSSSHTLGPWRAALLFLEQLEQNKQLVACDTIMVELYGSLALTGKGHGTDIAIMMGLCGKDPVTVPVDQVTKIPEQIQQTKKLLLAGTSWISFDPSIDIILHMSESLPLHANGMRLLAFRQKELLHQGTYYSIGGGFVQQEGSTDTSTSKVQLPYPIRHAKQLIQHCQTTSFTISEVVMRNELQWRSAEAVLDAFEDIWQVMLSSMYRGCHTQGILPGGLDVSRRAFGINQKLLQGSTYDNIPEWMACIKNRDYRFSDIMKWIGCFAMAVNEENANFGRIVTAPTNGASGVIPAVIMYYLLFENPTADRAEIYQFLLVAGEVGSLFKKGSTISAAMGGCQAEIGVSSAMAAAALCELLGGSVDQVLMAAEIAMEHHLGLTCDPVQGLVQVPCIERNSMGAIKAINAAKIAIESDPSKAKISLDAVIKTMLHTAEDMNHKYKETSQGGLAVNIAISLPEC